MNLMHRCFIHGSYLVLKEYGNGVCEDDCVYYVYKCPIEGCTTEIRQEVEHTQDEMKIRLDYSYSIFVTPPEDWDKDAG